jgi:accessory colonization factor AcfC
MIILSAEEGLEVVDNDGIGEANSRSQAVWEG